MPWTKDIASINTSGLNADHLAMFFCRARSRIITKRIQNSSTATSWASLFSKRKHFYWTSATGTISYDGHIINPSTYVGVSDLKMNLQESRLVRFQFNVTGLTDKILADYELILEQKGKHDDMVLDLFNALLSSSV